MKKYKLGDIVTLQNKTICPISGTTYNLYSLPAFDMGKVCEIVDGVNIQSNKFVVPNKCILFNKLNVRFKRVWCINNEDKNKVSSTEFLPLIVDETKVNYHYCYYLLISDRITNYLCGQNTNTSGSHKRIDSNDFFNIDVFLPPMTEQENIGKILVSLDHKIALNREINQNLEKMIADTMDYMFLSNKHLMQKRLVSDIAVIKAGGDCPTEWSKYKTDEFNVPIYSNGIDNEGLYGYAKEAVISERSITVAARGTIGYCVLREGGYTPIIRLLAVTPNDIGGDVYLNQIFSRIKFKKDGSIQQQLTVPSLASIEIPYPNASELMCFAQKTYPIIDIIKQNKQQIVELAKQRDELLPLLMNGQVSVNSDLSAC